MALFHLDVMVIHKTHAHPGAGGLSQYLRTGVGDLRRYMERADPGREDLVAYGEAGLPSWAKHGTHFFAMANQYEARKDAAVARHIQITFPRELSEQGRLDLAQDLRDAFFASFPHVWAVHNPQAKDGSGEQPHLHVLLSPRRDDGIPRTPKHWFAGLGRDEGHPEERRVPIDRTWGQKRTLQGLRHETAILINAALEREGIPLAVSPDRLRGQGHERSGVHYTRQGREADIAQALAAQAALRRDGVQAWEQSINVLAWDAQKAREGIRDSSREAIVDHVRDRFWAHDQSVAREQERAQSFERAVDREYARTGRERPVPIVYEHTLAIPRRRGWSHEQERDLAYHGAQVNLYEREHR